MTYSSRLKLLKMTCFLNVILSLLHTCIFIFWKFTILLLMYLQITIPKEKENRNNINIKSQYLHVSNPKS